MKKVEKSISDDSGVTSTRQDGIMSKNPKGEIIMFSKSIILAVCAAALFVAGCGPSKEEIAKQNAQVASLRQSLEKARDCTVDLIQLKKYENSGGTLKLEVAVERANKLLAQPADVKQLPALVSAMKELNGAADALQAEVDKRIDAVHQMNEKVKKAGQN